MYREEKRGELPQGYNTTRCFAGVKNLLEVVTLWILPSVVADITEGHEKQAGYSPDLPEISASAASYGDWRCDGSQATWERSRHGFYM